MRQTIREIEVNVAYRWFIGYSLTESMNHFSTFEKNYLRRFARTNIFERILAEAQQELEAEIDELRLADGKKNSSRRA